MDKTDRILECIAFAPISVNLVAKGFATVHLALKRASSDIITAAEFFGQYVVKDSKYMTAPIVVNSVS